MFLLSMFHTKKLILPTQGRPCRIIMHHFVVSEIRHVIFYDAKKSCKLQKLKRFHNKSNVMCCPFKFQTISFTQQWSRLAHLSCTVRLAPADNSCFSMFTSDFSLTQFELQHTTNGVTWSVENAHQSCDPLYNSCIEKYM